MGEAAYNLVTISGNKRELERLEKIAYKNDSEAFCLGNFIIDSQNSTAPHQAVFSTNWVAFGILIEKNENFLKYYFNSKNNAADLGYLADRFPELDFTQVYVEIDGELVGYRHYRKDENPTFVGGFDYWANQISPHQYLFMEDVALKLDYLHSHATRAIDMAHFFDKTDRKTYLKQYSKQYERIVKRTLELEKQDLFYARYGMAYTLHSHTAKDIARFIKSFILPDKRNKLLGELLEQYRKVTKERCWWNCLNHEWKKNLINCLIDFNPKYKRIEKKLKESEKNPVEISHHIESLILQDETVIKDILKLNEIVLSLPLVFDNPDNVLNQFSKLQNITLNLSDYNYSFWKRFDFEEIVRFINDEYYSKVKNIELNYINLDDLSILTDFPNLKEFSAQGSHIWVLDGIEKCKKLKSFTADQGNYYSDLNSLMKLKLEYLNIQFSKVNDLTPLIFMPSLKILNTSYCPINDYHPLLLLPNLLSIEITEKFIPIEADTNEEFKILLKQYLIDNNQFSQQRLDELADLQQHPKKYQAILKQKEEKNQQRKKPFEEMDDLPF